MSIDVTAWMTGGMSTTLSRANIRGLFLKGVSLGELWREAGALLVIGTVAIVASVLCFRKRLE
jgi:hypothetical protein